MGKLLTPLLRARRSMNEDPALRTLSVRYLLISGPIPDASHKKSREVAHLIKMAIWPIASRLMKDRVVSGNNNRVYCKSE